MVWLGRMSCKINAMNLKQPLVSTVLAAILLLVGSASVFGCECMARNDFEVEFALSKAVFAGEVIDANTSGPDTIVTFRVHKSWKGAKTETVVVKTNGPGKSCGFNFTKGASYLVYANDDGSLRTSICSRTAAAGCAGDDIQKLEDSGWSAPVNGLRSRLSVLPSDKPDSPFYRVFIEMQNVSNTMGQKKIRFSPDSLELQVTDVTNGKPLPVANGPYDGMKPFWDPTPIPYGGSIKFQVSFPGMGYRPADKLIVDMGPMKTWVLPPDGWYMLSGRLVISAQTGDHPYMDWSGTLELPKVRIPKAN